MIIITILDRKIIFVQLTIQIRTIIILTISSFDKMIMIIRLRRRTIVKCRFVFQRYKILLFINFDKMFIKINNLNNVKTIIKIKIKNFFISFISNALRRSKINHIVNRRHNSSSLNNETRSIFNRYIDFFNRILSIQLITNRRINKNFSKNISKITLKIEIFSNRSVFIMTTTTI